MKITIEHDGYGWKAEIDQLGVAFQTLRAKSRAGIFDQIEEALDRYERRPNVERPEMQTAHRGPVYLPPVTRRSRRLQEREQETDHGTAPENPVSAELRRVARR